MDDLIERLRANGLDECDEAVARLEELEAKGLANRLAIMKLEAKLAKAVAVLERMEDASRYFGNDPEASETTVRYAHETTRRLCSTTIAKVKQAREAARVLLAETEAAKDSDLGPWLRAIAEGKDDDKKATPLNRR